MIVLETGAWQAAIWPERGARVMRLAFHGQPILREPVSSEDLDKNPMVYGIPFLFPPNRTDGGRFSFEGKEYRLPVNEPQWKNHIHGLFADAPFEVVEEGKDRLLTKVENKGNLFPFPCRVEMLDLLTEKGFRRETRIINTGSGRMPVEIAFHTTFASGESVQVPLALRWETDERYLPTGRMLALSSWEEQLCLGADTRGQIVSGFYTAAGHTAQIGDFLYTVSENFTDWITFNGKGQEWICLEPQSGPVNGLNLPGGCTVLEPGEEISFWQEIRKN